MDEKEIRRELRRVRHKETELLTKNRYKKSFSLESVLNRYIPDSIEETLDAAFREAFKLIFAKGTPVIGKTFNEKRLRRSERTESDSQKRRATDMFLTSVEGTGLGLFGVGLPDIPVFTGMLLRTVYQTASSYQFNYTSKTEQVFILKLIEAALTRGRQAEALSREVDALMKKIDTEGYLYFGSINDQIAKTSKALSDETLYLKFVQTVPIVGIAGGLSNPIYLNKVQSYAEVKYKKRRLLIQLRHLKESEESAAEQISEPESAPDSVPERAPEQKPASEPENTPEPEDAPARSLTVSVYDPENPDED